MWRNSLSIQGVKLCLTYVESGLRTLNINQHLKYIASNSILANRRCQLHYYFFNFKFFCEGELEERQQSVQACQKNHFAAYFEEWLEFVSLKNIAHCPQVFHITGSTWGGFVLPPDLKIRLSLLLLKFAPAILETLTSWRQTFVWKLALYY